MTTHDGATQQAVYGCKWWYLDLRHNFTCKHCNNGE